MKDIYEKVFLDYKIKLDLDYAHFLPEKRYAFISPSHEIQKMLPGVIDKLGLSWWTENKWFAIDFIKNTRGDVLVTLDRAYGSLDIEGKMATTTFIKGSHNAIMVTYHLMESNRAPCGFS